MPSFRRVEGNRAGPDALGILIPPGPRTFVILRPRSLSWDLLLFRPGEEDTRGAVAWEVGRDEAANLAQRLHRALEDWPGPGPGGIEPVQSSDGTGFQVRADIGPLTLVVCQRVPGQPYRPQEFTRVEEARQAAADLLGALRPGPETTREVYFNTRNFTR